MQGVWISSDDGSNLVQISNPNYASGSPQWSPDGSRIAFDSLPHDRWEIYVADVAEGKPRKLVTSISNVVRPHWSRDGKWIYFRSSEVGRMGVYRCPASGGDAVLLTKDIDAVSPQEALDGKTVYFASDHDKSTLRKVTLLGIARYGVRSGWIASREPPQPLGPLSQAVSILFRPRRPDRSATLISLPGRYAQFLKWTRTSVAACRSLPTAAGSTIH